MAGKTTGSGSAAKPKSAAGSRETAVGEKPAPPKAVAKGAPARREESGATKPAPKTTPKPKRAASPKRATRATSPAQPAVAATPKAAATPPEAAAPAKPAAPTVSSPAAPSAADQQARMLELAKQLRQEREALGKSREQAQRHRR